MNQTASAKRTRLDVSFGGVFSTEKGYTNPTGEQMDGALTRRTSRERITEGQFYLGGHEDGLDFNLRTPLHVENETTIDEAIVVEAIFKTDTAQKELNTIISVGGSIYVRYVSATEIEYGFDVQHDGQWSAVKQKMAAPEVDRENTIAIVYEPTDKGAILHAYLNGVELPTASSGVGRVAWTSDVENTISFGNDNHVKALNRGFVGSFSRILITSFEGIFHPELVTMTKLLAADKKLSVLEKLEKNEYIPVNLEPGYQIPIKKNECAAALATKASFVRPRPKQVTWQAYEQTAFIHYGINTYYQVEWGDLWKHDDPTMFNPTDLDTDQWARALRDSGFKMAVLTAKHHDGFTLYPSRYTEFGVKNSPWKDGKGDVLREFVTSMHKYGIKVGIYLSPSDHGAFRDGVFANESARTLRTIPTLVDGDDRIGNTTLPTFNLPATDYGAMLLNQLYEVLTEYGEVDEVWFDGAQGNIPGNTAEKYDWDSFYTLIEQLVPEAVIAVVGDDVRWVGNESGWARENEWSILGATRLADGQQAYHPSFSAPDLGSQSALVDAAENGMDYLTWWPAEVDVSIRDGWFYHDQQQPKSIANLRNIYYQSVARNAVLLLNIPPNREGKFAEADVQRLKEWHESIQRDLARNHAENAEVEAENGASGANPAVVIDGQYASSWKAASTEPSSVTFTFDEAVQVERVLLQENIHFGQQVESFTIEVRNDIGEWQVVYANESIGYKRIATLPEPVLAKQFRVQILKSRGIVHLSTIGLYEASALSTS